jgi:serine/threonine protein kinase
MEYADGGELMNYVEEKKGLSELECRSLFKQLVSAIKACHSQGIIHRDLKLENVLFESKARSRIKIVDFGIAGRCTPSITDKTDAGTLRFMAPEVLKGSDTKASPAIDIWALGCMLYCMLFYKYPFNGENGKEVKDKIVNQELSLPKDTAHTEDCADLIKGMLTKDPAKRYDLITIEQHKWMLLSDSAIELKL